MRKLKQILGLILFIIVLANPSMGQGLQNTQENILMKKMLHQSNKTKESPKEQGNMFLKTIAFYNLENLFDTVDDPKIKDEEFLPESNRKWNNKRYDIKLKNMAKVINQIGVNPKLGNTEPPIILGVCEVENRKVLEDLIKTSPLASIPYGICHFDSPDFRGIDVGLLYNKKYFKVLAENTHRVTFDDDATATTRDQLVVTGKLNGETVSFVVNHWPSRRGGEKRSEPRRINAANMTRRIVDSLKTIDENAKVIIMGDFNDGPKNNSVMNTLKAKFKPSKLKDKDVLFNPMLALHKQGHGTLAHRDIWQIFDMLIISQPLLDTKSNLFYYPNSARIFKKDYLENPKGKFEGYPNRTYVGSTFNEDGYSDHFPVYIYLGVKG